MVRSRETRIEVCVLSCRDRSQACLRPLAPSCELGSSRGVGGATMRLTDDALKSVVFLCVEGSGEEMHFGGTAFFVAVRSETVPEKRYGYLVTAKHNVESAKRRA